MNRLLYPETVFECHDGRRLTGNRPDQFAAFDDLEIVEAEAMAGRRNEAVIGLVTPEPPVSCGSPVPCRVLSA